MHVLSDENTGFFQLNRRKLQKRTYLATIYLIWLLILCQRLDNARVALLIKPAPAQPKKLTHQPKPFIPPKTINTERTFLKAIRILNHAVATHQFNAVHTIPLSL